MENNQQTDYNLYLPSERLDHLFKKIEILNKKAKKCGVTDIVCQIGTEKVEMIEENPVAFTNVCLKFAPIVKAGNWRFIASIEHEVVNGENKNLIFGYDLDHDDEVKFRSVASHCDHCNVNRQRNSTFIVKSADGDLKQVGKSCLTDYMGVSVEAALSSLFISSEIVSIIDEESDIGSGYKSNSSSMKLLSRVVEMSVATISTSGFISNAKAQLHNTTPTSALVSLELNPPIRYKSVITVTDFHKSVSKEIIERWTNDLMPKFEKNSDDLDSFQFKIALAIGLGWVKQKLLSTIVASVGREMNLINNEKLIKFENLNEFIPNSQIKDKVQLSVTIISIKKIDTDYGVTSLMRFRDNEGRSIIWFASSNICEIEWKVGSSVTIKGTVKDLKDTQQYGKQTILTRVKKL